jgi:hypothetical protein
MNRTLALGTGIALSVFLLETQLFPFRVDNPRCEPRAGLGQPENQVPCTGCDFRPPLQ